MNAEVWLSAIYVSLSIGMIAALILAKVPRDTQKLIAESQQQLLGLRDEQLKLASAEAQAKDAVILSLQHESARLKNEMSDVRKELRELESLTAKYARRIEELESLTAKYARRIEELEGHTP